MAEPWSLSITTALDNFLVDFCHRLLYLSGCDPEISTLAWFKFFCLTQWKRYLTCTLWLVQNLKSSSQRYWYLQCPLASQRVVTQVTQVKQKVYEICSGFSSFLNRFVGVFYTFVEIQNSYSRCIITTVLQ